MERIMDSNTEDFLEILYWEFDAEKKKGSFTERDLFKAKLRKVIRIVQQQYLTGEAMGERRSEDGWIVEHGNLSDLSVDELLTAFDGFHAGRLLWPGTAYAEVKV